MGPGTTKTHPISESTIAVDAAYLTAEGARIFDGSRPKGDAEDQP
jgi:hypothetical protein